MFLKLVFLKKRRVLLLEVARLNMKTLIHFFFISN